MYTNSNISKELIKLTSIDYPLFANYCIFIDKGLRKDAFKYLDSFLNNANNWDYPTKANFCKTIFSISTTPKNDIDFVLTSNLVNKLIKPTLLEMTIQEPENFLYFKWYGQYFRDTSYIKKAYELNPTDYSIRIILLNRLEYDIWISTHHLPDAYLGNIEEDEDNLKLAFSLLETLEKNKTDNFINIFTDYKNEIDIYKENCRKTLK